MTRVKTLAQHLHGITISDVVNAAVHACSEMVATDYLPYASSHVAVSLLRNLRVARQLPADDLATEAARGPEEFQGYCGQLDEGELGPLEDDLVNSLRGHMSRDDDDQYQMSVIDGEAQELGWELLNNGAINLFSRVCKAAG